MRGTLQIFEWTPNVVPGSFTRIYDDDVVRGSAQQKRPSNATASMTWEVNLCEHPWLPCSLRLSGTFFRQTWSIICQAHDGCTSITLRHATVQCAQHVWTPSAPFQVSGKSSSLRVEHSAVLDCWSTGDGGAFLAYNAEKVVISNSTVQGSFSQVYLNAEFCCPDLLKLGNAN